MKASRWLLLVSAAALLSGCSWMDSTSPAEQARLQYESGMKAYEAKDYKTAVIALREVPADSALYAQSVRTIQRVPYQRGVDAYESGEYLKALTELTKIPEHHPDHENARLMRVRIEYELLRQEYEKAVGAERLEWLRKLIAKGGERQSETVDLENIDDLGRDLATSSDPKMTSELLTLMQATLQERKSPMLYERALEHLMRNFQHLHEQREIRAQAFEVVGQVKLAVR